MNQFFYIQSLASYTVFTEREKKGGRYEEFPEQSEIEKETRERGGKGKKQKQRTQRFRNSH